MAITVNLYYEEKGNLKYEYFYPMEDPETVLLIDSWENQEAIDEHHKSPMTKTKLIKIIIDVLMYFYFIFLMSHGTVRNLNWHAYAGIALFVLFLVHHILTDGFIKRWVRGVIKPTEFCLVLLHGF